MSVSINNAGNSDLALSQPSSGSDFASASATPDLQVSGNTIDTGRYLITASKSYTTGAAYNYYSTNDGCVKVYDKQTDTYVQVFGDPHLETSSEVHGEFKQDGLVIDLADGTQVQVQPTAQNQYGDSHIHAVSVTKNNQTSFITGVYNETGNASDNEIKITAPKTGNAFQLDKTFDSYSDTVLHVGSSLNDLHFANGTSLPTSGNTMLDRKGGGVQEFLNQRVPMKSIDSAIQASTTMAAQGKQTVSGPEYAAASVANLRIETGSGK